MCSNKRTPNSHHHCRVLTSNTLIARAKPPWVLKEHLSISLTFALNFLSKGFKTTVNPEARKLGLTSAQLLLILQNPIQRNRSSRKLSTPPSTGKECLLSNPGTYPTTGPHCHSGLLCSLQQHLPGVTPKSLGERAKRGIYK